MPTPYQYDPFGNYPPNLITNEQHSVTPPTASDQANFIVPDAAPFFALGLIVRSGPASTDPVLVEGTDYILTHRFVEASQFLNRQIYGSITFLNQMYSGMVWLTYQTLGGTYTLDDYSIVENLTRSLYSIRVVTWTQVVPLVAAFPPLPHPHNVADLTGMADVVVVLNSILTALQQSGGNVNTLATTLQTHLNAVSSHSKSQVGLGLLDNFRTATQQDIENGVPNAYVTPQMLIYGIERFVTGSGSVGLVLDLLASSVQRAYNGSSEQYEDSLLLNNAFVTVDCDNYVKEGKYWVTDMANIANAPFSWCVMEVTNIAVESTNPAVGEVLQIFDDGLGRRARRIRQYVSTGVYQWSDFVITTNDTVLPPSGTGPLVPITGSSIDLNDYTTTGNFSFSTAVFPANAPPSYGPATTFQLQVLVTPVLLYTVQIAKNTTSNKTYIRGGYRNDNDYIDFYGHYWRQVPTIDSILNDTYVNNILTDGSYLCRVENSSTVNISVGNRHAFLLYVKNSPTMQRIVQVMYNLIDTISPYDELYQINVRGIDFNEDSINHYTGGWNPNTKSVIDYFLSITDMLKLQNYLVSIGVDFSAGGYMGLSYELQQGYIGSYGAGGTGRILVDTDLNRVTGEGYYIFRHEDNVLNVPTALNNTECFYVVLMYIRETIAVQTIFQAYGEDRTSSLYVRHQLTNDWNNGVTPPNWVLLPN